MKHKIKIYFNPNNNTYIPQIKLGKWYNPKWKYIDSTGWTWHFQSSISDCLQFKTKEEALEFATEWTLEQDHKEINILPWFKVS